MTSYYFTMQFYKKSKPATFSSNSLQINLQWITSIDFKEEGQDDMEGPRAGRRTIEQVAGHKINLEIEGVQDKIKIEVKSID